MVEVSVESTLGTGAISDGEQDDDVDSALGDDNMPEAASTESLTESISAYRKLHGRSYANYQTAVYWAPNDHAQNTGLDLFHEAVRMIFGNKLFSAPIIGNLHKVLDLGTGTGTWATEFADEFPGSEVVGIDISPIQPVWSPPNLTFEIDDMNLEWTWPENHFSFIHARMLYGCVPDWMHMYQKIYRHLVPGGWLENLEIDIAVESDHLLPHDREILDIWTKLFSDVGSKLGRSFRIARGHEMKQNMTDARFTEIGEKKFRIPCGLWRTEEEVGTLVQEFLLLSLEGMALYPATEVLGWKVEEVMVLSAKMRNIVKQPKAKPYIVATVVYGRKPV